MELSRRNFLKGTGALAGISAMGAIGLGCSPAANEGTEAKGGKAEAPKTPAETTPTTLKEATDGKFTAKAMGHENYVYVEATMAGGAIANLRVLAHDETVGVGSLATEMWPAKVVETQNLDVDAISGATTTCTAIKNAAIEAISNSGADVSQFQKGAQAPEKGEDQTIDTDVVIMGAGTAGLTAATRLARKRLQSHPFREAGHPRRLHVHDVFRSRMCRQPAAKELLARSLRLQPVLRQRRNARRTQGPRRSRERPFRRSHALRRCLVHHFACPGRLAA